MKITGPSDTPRAQPGANGASRAQTPAAKSAGNGQGSSVQLSTMSSRLNQLEAQFPGSFDEEKVSQIRSAIASGTYQVNAGAVADKLIASAAQLAGRSA